jgi:hypothetical protein
MREPDFAELAGLMADVVTHDVAAAEPVTALRSRFLDLQFCFGADELGAELDGLVAFLR